MKSPQESHSQQRLLTSYSCDGARLSTVVTFAFTGAKSFVTGNWKLNLRNKEKRWKQEKIRNNRETKILRQCSSFYANAHLPSQIRRLSARIRSHRCRLPLLRRTDNARPYGKKWRRKHPRRIITMRLLMKVPHDCPSLLQNSRPSFGRGRKAVEGLLGFWTLKIITLKIMWSVL